ncbi:BglG family transcription antiterminator [Marinilactibacillus kalidii]|uniref:BglG family transcription antiterminator n=1 Tax=Marinilactibacillus kalidii TaxID=2820274 RepID=UPI001ABE3414|nr:BglG family transcription antiterminator [Marinilactibacillus kalidii]
MFDQARHFRIYQLIKDKPEVFNSERLGENLTVSSRTIRNDVKEMNGNARNYGFEINLKRGCGYWIDIIDNNRYVEFENEQVNNLHDVSNCKERIRYFIRMLLFEKQVKSLEEYAEALYISRSTLTNDLPAIKSTLAEYKLTFVSKVGKGVSVEGNEKDKRYALMSLFNPKTLTQLSIHPFFQWSDSLIRDLREKIPNMLQQYAIVFTDENLENFIYHLLVMYTRIKNQFILKDLDIYDIDESGSEFINELKTYLEAVMEIEITDAELSYLSILIKSKTIHSLEQDEEDRQREQRYINDLLSTIKAHYQYELTDDEQLKNDLINHIHSMFYRFDHDIRVRNPMEEHIQKFYPLAFEVTLNAVESVKDRYSYSINDGEVAYLALHIGAALERNYQIEYARHTTCLIVCGAGVGTARMIETSIRRTLPNLFVIKTISAQKYHQLEYIEEDVVLTTVEINKKNKPVFKVDNLPSKKELIALNHQIEDENNLKEDIFSKFFSPSLFIKETFKSKTQLISEMVARLDETDLLMEQTDFLASVLERESLGSTALAEGLAIPHPMGLFAKKTRIVVALLEEDLIWDKNRSVKVVFLIAISKEDYEEALGIYDFFVESAREEKYIELLSATTYEAFIKIARS